MSEKPGDKNWLDFQKIKEGADIEGVLGHCGVLEHLERRGDELVGWCPLGEEHGKRDSFAFNASKRTFQCFACKARGSILDFVRSFKKCDLRSAAAFIAELPSSASPANSHPAKRPGRPYGKAAPIATAPESRRETPALSVEVLSWDAASAAVNDRALPPEELVVLRIKR